ncbi:bifunctional hydroxymethylpyrimidine kinase/phosphomethylpyrimidine kinase [Sphingomonas radiodurans]|uniref:bifunctional hydroxymethylpyrimidine kinase/phosphomethylpyrimidine kinase n=1 Tax=Sphingomonas radiodurans TaxID=2890321 RepID=UPI001E3731B5|nr:bifunctional hydroxymethylpyrimidine kinase/phosphomethylpyrimidine kinase [Sphingomonas radiodurans]WBH15353.1 bifunctional hydroxymethylpyrimidine kinase/phosphomethylpyrimidine kinase [Sphingomonas radiodurans]
MTARILIIAGSDSGGGAGIQADIKTVTMLGGHAMTAVTAITAQNTVGVQGVHPIPTEMVVQQMRSCIDDIGVDAVKIGMIGSAATAHAVADVLETLSPSPRSRGEGRGEGQSQATPSAALPLSQPSPLKGRGLPIVFDPVMIATSGSILADADTITAFDRLMRLATLVTPNLPELVALGGKGAVLETGAALLVKGGHAEGDKITDRLLDQSGEVTSWTAPRIDTPHTHGTGCTLASAIAEGLGRGLPLPQATARARRFVRIALREAPGLGAGHGPMGHQKVRLDSDVGGATPNQITLPATNHAASFAFYKELGLTPIVDSDGRYARFESAGGTTLSIEAADEIDAKPILFLEVADLDVAVTAARAHGIAVTDPIDQSWGWREARLSDPAGNALRLYTAGENRRFPPWRLTCPD